MFEFKRKKIYKETTKTCISVGRAIVSCVMYIVVSMVMHWCSG